MRLKDCNTEEVTILTAALALLTQLPADPAHYTSAIGELRETFFKTKGRGRGRKPAGVVVSHDIRVTPRGL